MVEPESAPEPLPARARKVLRPSETAPAAPAEAKSEEVAAQSAVAQTQVSGDPDGHAARSFSDELRDALERLKQYPALARARRQTGRVEVGFTLRKDGAIENSHIEKACQFELLNEAALQTVRRLGRFKPIPDEISAGNWNVVVPIEFRLKG